MFAICSYGQIENSVPPMTEQLRAYFDEQATALDESVRQALEICGGDAVAALRAALIANAFLQEEIEAIKQQVSTGFARGRVRKPAPRKEKRDQSPGNVP